MFPRNVPNGAGRNGVPERSERRWPGRREPAGERRSAMFEPLKCAMFEPLKYQLFYTRKERKSRRPFGDAGVQRVTADAQDQVRIGPTDRQRAHPQLQVREGCGAGNARTNARTVDSVRYIT